MKALAVKFFIVILVFANCTPEQVEEAQGNIILNAMTNGQWRVSNYMKGSADITADFAIYKFQFHQNLKVDAILTSNNMIEKSGTWNADAIARTISSNFTNASATLNLLNGTWLITNTTFTTVEANQTVNGELRILKLVKI